MNILIKRHSWKILAVLLLVILLFCRYDYTQYFGLAQINRSPGDWNGNTYSEILGEGLLDTDGDTIPDIYEVDGDTDGDGVPDYLDPDDDGDGIPTITEVEDGEVWGADVDGDGIPNYLDDDSDGDGIPDADEWTDLNENGEYDEGEMNDFDEDGIPDYLDPDDCFCSLFTDSGCLVPGECTFMDVPLNCLGIDTFIVVDTAWEVSSCIGGGSTDDDDSPPVKPSWSPSGEDSGKNVYWEIYIPSWGSSEYRTDSEPTESRDVIPVGDDGTPLEVTVCNNYISDIEYTIEIRSYNCMPEGWDIPGFELMFLLGAITICILIIKRGREK